MPEDKNQLQPGDTLEEAKIKHEASKNSAPKEEVPAWAKALAEKVDNLEEENKSLKELAGKNALASLEASKKDHTKKVAHFKVMNEKIVVGWEKGDNSKFVPSAKSASLENLNIILHYKDETKEEVPYHTFISCSELVYADLVDFKPMGVSKVKFPDGDEVKVDFKFLNA